MKHLYDQDVHVFFKDDNYWSVCGQPIIAMFSKKDEAPPSFKDFKTWEMDPKCSITYKGTLFSPIFLPPYTWCSLVHEVTHYEIGMSNETDFNNVKTFKHGKSFKAVLERNLTKVDDLRRKFNKELGWDEDFIYIYHDDGEFIITPRSPWILISDRPPLFL